MPVDPSVLRNKFQALFDSLRSHPMAWMWLGTEGQSLMQAGNAALQKSDIVAAAVLAELPPNFQAKGE